MYLHAAPATRAVGARAARRDDRETWRAAVRNAGLRATRRGSRCFACCARPARRRRTATWVAELASQAWDPATIYRQPDRSIGRRLARRTDVGDHVWRYEAITGHQASVHSHSCTECGSVECPPDLEYVVTRAKTPRAVRLKRGEVQLRGPCDACLHVRLGRCSFQLLPALSSPQPAAK